MTRMNESGLPQRRFSFDSISRLYDSVRPGYPADLIQDLVTFANISKDCHILEVGAGTGQLTLPLWKSGADITVLEPGKDLAMILSEKIPDIRVISGEFETADFGDGEFDVVVFATSFHWIDKETRVKKTGSLLGPGGFVAVIETHHVNGGTSEFFRASQECYRIWDKNTVEGYVLPEPAEINDKLLAEEFSESFTPMYSRGYQWTEEYSADEYARLIRTYSDVLSMDTHKREGLVNCLKNQIDTSFSGKIEKGYLNWLFTGRKKQ